MKKTNLSSHVSPEGEPEEPGVGLVDRNLEGLCLPSHSDLEGGFTLNDANLKPEFFSLDFLRSFSRFRLGRTS